MAVRLRLRRIGKRGRPFYRICAMDARTARGGEYLESLGHYDPFIVDKDQKVTLDVARAEYWIGQGAEPSETVRSFLRAKKVQGLPTHKKNVRRKTPASRVKAAKAAKAASKSGKPAGKARKPKKKAKAAE